MNFCFRKKIKITLLLFALFQFAFSETIDVWNDGMYIFTYNLDRNKETITCTLDVGVSGWVGLGFSKDGMMPHSDMIMGYIDKEGKAVVEDRYAKGHYQPVIDTSLDGTNDLTDISGSYENNRTKLTFTRKLVTNDKYDMDIKKDEQLFLMFAYGENGNPSNENGEYNFHSNILSMPIILYPSVRNLRYLEDSTSHTMKVNFENFEIPKNKTTYECKYFKINDLIKEQTGLSPDTKYHLTGFAPVKTNRRVHHMILYGCDETDEFDSNYESCEIMNPKCPYIVALAGVSSPSVEYPSQVGLIWGSNSTKIVRLEIHYDNSDLASGEKDSSGFKITFTDQLRPNNLAVTTFSYPMEKISLPPHKEMIEIQDTCPSTCSSQLQSKGFDILWVAIHGHKTMRNGRFDIIYQNGTIDSTTFKVDNYDFNTQYFKILLKPIHISPGDSFRTVCGYDTSLRNSTTPGGLSSDDEMCMAFVGYYPAENGIGYCSAGLCKLY